MPSISRIKYGSIIYLRHCATGTFLKSLPKNYIHPDGSGQQMVVAALAKTDETRWLIKGPHVSANKYPRGEEVTHGNKIRLEHCATRRNLHSHPNHRSPVSGQQEVTCIGFNGVCDENDDWIVEIDAGGIWKFDEKVRLIHAKTDGALHSHNSGFNPLTNGEQEVTAYANRDDNDLWIVATGDQPSITDRFNISLASRKTALDLLSIAGSIASITGWTLFTLGKTLRTTTLAELLSYILSAASLIGVFMIVLSMIWGIYLRMSAKPLSLLARRGYWLLTSSLTLLSFLLLWRGITFLQSYAVLPAIRWALGG